MGMSMGEFVNFLLLLLEEKKVGLSLDEAGRRHWHELLYRLYKLPSEGYPDKPGFFQHIFFSSITSYPYCEDLAEYLDALCGRTACVESFSPAFREHRVSRGVAALWWAELKKLPPWDRRFLDLAREMAIEEFARTTANA